MTLQLPLSTSAQPAKLSARDFWLLADGGAFEGFVKTELIEGVLQVVNAVHTRHARIHAALAGELGIAVKGSTLILLATPSVNLAGDSVPEPDLALASRADDKAVAAVDLRLAIEISDTTLDFDLGRKMRLYARHGVPEYWVVDVEGKVIHQNWQPLASGYAQERVVAFGTAISVATIDGLNVPTAPLG